MRKKILLMTFLVAIIGFCGTSLSAQVVNVAKVGNTEYETIDEAIANWTNNTTLTLLADVTLTDVINLSSTEYHILDLGNYTMTAASKKDAIQIVNNGRSSASYALDIKADAQNPGGITATGKVVVRTAGKSGVKDRPIIRFYNGVFNGSYVVYHTGSNGTNCPQFQFHGGVFNGTIYTNRTLNQFYGGVFNGSLQMSVDTSAYTLIAGGTFKQLSNLYMSALNSDKFTIGSAKRVYDKEVYIDDGGNYVIAAAEPAQGIEADVAKTPGTNDYLAYSKVATEGQLGYTDVYTALEKNTSATVTVYVEELDLEDSNFKGTIVVPEGKDITITNAPAGITVKRDKGEGNFEIIKPSEDGTITTIVPTEVATYDELVAALAKGGVIKLTDDITVDTKITAVDGTVIDLNDNTLYVNVENSYYNNVTIKNGDIILGKDDVHVCDGYFLVNAGKTLELNGVNVSSSEAGIKAYAVFHLKTGANLDLINSTLNIADNEYTAGYIVYAGEATATVDVVGTTITGSKVNGIVHATTVIDNSTVTLTNVIEHGINRSGVTIDDSNVTISGGTGRGITAQHGPLVVKGNSNVSISEMGEATIELRNNQDLTVESTATVTVDVAVNNTTSGTITGNITVNESLGKVAKIGENKYYKTLQDAINAVQNDETITLLSDITEKLVNIEKASGVTFTIDGSKGTRNSNSNWNFTGELEIGIGESITIKNINFVATDEISPEYFIDCMDKNSNCVLTITGCNFTDKDFSTAVIGTHQPTQVVIDGCNATGVHSLLQNQGGYNITVKNTTVNGKRGMSLGTVVGATVENVNIIAADDKYGIRLNGEINDNTIKIKDCKVQAFIPVVVRNAKVESYNVIFEGTNTMTAKNTDGLWCAIGTTEYETNGTMPTAPTGKVTVTLNDTGLDAKGIYGNYAPIKLQDANKNVVAFHTNFEDALAAAIADENVVRMEISEDVTQTTVKDTENYYDIKRPLSIGTAGDVVTVSINPNTGSAIAIRVMGDGASLTIEENLTIDHLDVVANGFATNNESMVINGTLKALSLKQWTNGNAITVSETGSVWLGYGDGQFDMAYGNGTVTINGNGNETEPQFKAGYSGTRGNGNTLNLNNTYFEGGAWFNVEGSNGTFNIDNSVLKVSGGDGAGSLKVASSGNKFNLTNGAKLNVATLTLEAGNNITIDGTSQVVVTTLSGNGTINIDVTNLTETSKPIVGNASNFAGEIKVINNDDLKVIVDENGNVLIVEKDYVAQIGDDKYEDLQEALSAVQNGETITLINNITLTEGVIVAADKTVILDLNGKTITGTPAEAVAFAVITNKGNLTIVDNTDAKEGKIVCDHKLAGSTNYAVNTITNSCNLTIEAGTIQNTSTASNQIGYAIDNNSTTGNAVLVINGGKVKVTASGSNYYDGIRQFCNSLTNENSVTIKDGEISSLWLQNSSDGTTDRNTKDVKGSFAIEGGTLNNLYLEPSTQFAGAITNGHVGSVSVFESAEGRDLEGFITGGTFSNEVPAEFLAPGCKLEEQDGVYGVVPFVTKEYAIDANGEIKTFVEAIAKAKEEGADIVTYTIYGAATLETGGSHGIVDFGGKAGYITIQGGSTNMRNAETDSFTITGGGVPDIKGVAFKDLTFYDEGTYLTTANEFMYQNFIDCTFENVVFEDGIRLSGNSVVTNCTFNANTYNEYAIWLDEGTFEMTGSEVIAGNEAYGLLKSDLVEKITITDNTFQYLGDANKEALNVKNAIIIATGNEFIDCEKGVVPTDKTNYTEDGTVISNEIIEVNNTITVTPPVAQIGETYYKSLQAALNAAAAGTGNVTIQILRDVDLTGIDWNPVTVSAPGYPLVTVNGNSKTITGLNDMLFAGTWAGGSGLIINDLTIYKSTIVNDKDDTKGTVGVGAFIGYPQASATITLNNCHLKESHVEGGHWTGGLIGMAGGYNGNDGPVFMNLTIANCSVTGSTITGKGSAGGIIGHGSCAAWTNVDINETTVSGNTVTSTGSSTNKAGAIMGTIGAAGQPTTANGVTLTGGATVSATVSGNTVTSGGTPITTIYGRQGSSTGMLELSGGSYDNYPIEEGVAYAAPVEGYEIVENANGTYGVEKSAVAKIGDTEYKSLQAAITEAGTEETTINVIANTTEDITIQDGANIILNFSEDITLNGYFAPFRGKLTINGGTINNTNSGASAIEINDGELNLNDVNIASARHAVRIDGDVTATINGGEYKLTATSGTRHTVNVSGGAEVTIKAGTFVGPKGTTMDSGSAVCVQAGATVTIEGGDFSGGKNATLGVTGTMTVTGGTFDQDPSAYLAQGYITKYNETTSRYEVFFGVAQINNTYYASLQDAIDAAENNDVIKVISDYEMDITSGVTNSGGYYVLANVADKNVVIDLNGKKVTVDVTNLPEGCKDNMLRAVFCADTNGKLTLKDSDENKNGSVSVTGGNVKTVYSLVIAYDGLVNIESGNYSVDYMPEGRGMIYGNVGDGDGNTANTDKGVNISGGNFKLGNVGTLANGSPWILATAGSNTGKYIFVTGGTYNDNILNQHWVFEVLAPTSKALQNNNNGTYTIVDAVAFVRHLEYSEYYSETGFATLEEAFEIAETGDVITLVKETELANAITIAAGKEIVLDLNGKVVSYQSDIVGEDMITNKGKLTIESSVEGGKLTYKNTDVTGENVTISTISTEPGSELIINGGIIENTSLANNTSKVLVPYTIDILTNGNLGDVTVTINGGSIISENYIAIRQFVNGNVCNNSLTVKGGSITAKKRAINVQDAQGGGQVKNCAILHVEKGEITATEDGGYSICNLANSENISVTGGTFVGTVYSAVNGIISGGTFDEEPYYAYCAEGFAATNNDNGTWTVMPAQEQHLVAGWNWYSTYLDIELNELTSALGDNGSYIKNSKGIYVENIGGNSWLGELDAINPSEMYLVQTTTECNLKLAADLVDPSKHIISLNAEWSWIGYPSNQGVNINVALENLDANRGDIIKSLNDGYAEYAFGQWLGTLNTMVPGVGYKYNNKSGEAKTFYYNIEATRGAVEANITVENNYWTPNATKYPHNMTMTAVVDGLTDGNYEVAAFVNGEVRGSARPIYVEALDTYMFFLTIHGEDVEEMSFRLYDIDTDTEYDLNDRINYSNDAHLGSVNEPYVFSRGTTGIGEASMSNVNIYPNPTTTGTEINLQATCDKVEVFNALGVKVVEYQNVDSIDALETAGIYVIRITNNGNVQNCRLVVK